MDSRGYRTQTHRSGFIRFQQKDSTTCNCLVVSVPSYDMYFIQCYDHTLNICNHTVAADPSSVKKSAQ